MEQLLPMQGSYAESEEIRLLYADDRVVVCVKPQGILSTDEPGGMPERLRAGLGGPDIIIKTVHRLDRVTGGVMVYARTRHAASDLEIQMKEGLFHKTYLAVVHGCPADRQGDWTDYLRRDGAARKSIVVPPDSAMSQMAVLSYEVLAENNGLSLVKIALRTGRTHQIRCQFSAHGFPLVGDAKYGTGGEESPLALWAWKLSFRHPRAGDELCFSAAPPMRSVWCAFSDIIEKL